MWVFPLLFHQRVPEKCLCVQILIIVLRSCKILFPPAWGFFFFFFFLVYWLLSIIPTQKETIRWTLTLAWAEHYHWDKCQNAYRYHGRNRCFIFKCKVGYKKWEQERRKSLLFNYVAGTGPILGNGFLNRGSPNDWELGSNFLLSFILFLFKYAAAVAAKSLQSCSTLCDPIDGSPSGSPVPGILQAKTLEWDAISFSNASKWKVKVKSLSHARLLATPWTAAFQAPPSMGFSRQEYWSGVPLPSPLFKYNWFKCINFCYTAR